MASVDEKGEIDTTVVLPKALRKEVESVEQLHKSVYNPEPPKDPPVEAEPPKVEATPPVEPPAEVVPLVEPPVDDSTWEHKYKSMHGRYNAEVPKLRDQIRQLIDQVTALQAMAPRREEAPKPPPAKAKLVTEKDVSDYGSEFLDVVGRKAQEELSAFEQTLMDRIKFLESKIDGVGGKIAQTATETMYSTLDKEVPSWNEINASDEFIHWLHLPDTYSGVIRLNLLKSAFEQGNTSRVLAFFKGFLAEEAATAPAPKAAPTPDNSGKVPLIDLAAPGRAKTAASGHTPAPEKPIITTADITEFYRRVNTGYYAGRDKEKAEHEAMIFQAQKDGRLRG